MHRQNQFIIPMQMSRGATEMRKRILVVVDDRAVTQSAIRQAIEMAQAIRADIHFFSVLPAQGVVGFDSPPVAEISKNDLGNEAIAYAQKLLSAASEWAEREGIHSLCASSDSDGAQCVSDVATKRHCSLIVVGAEGGNTMPQHLSGSIVAGLISAAVVPVLVCRDSGSSGGFWHRDSVSFRARQWSRELLERREGERND